MKMPKQVLRKVYQIQSRFLWGGTNNINKNHWVQWDDVCLPKDQGGLGVGKLEFVNLSLLAKWKWKLKHDTNDFWKLVLKARYEEQEVKDFVEQGRVGSYKALAWWKAICEVGNHGANEICAQGNWFEDGITRRLGNGSSILFWKDKWLSDVPLSQLFLRFFKISVQKELVVNQVGKWESEVWYWDLL